MSRHGGPCGTLPRLDPRHGRKRRHPSEFTMDPDPSDKQDMCVIPYLVLFFTQTARKLLKGTGICTVPHPVTPPQREDGGISNTRSQSS